MPDTYWLNGRFIARDEAKVSAFDAAVQHGVGLFETMHAARGRIFRLGHHMRRLRDSALALGLSDSLRDDRLAEAAHGVLERSGLAEGEAHARVRLTITGGDLNLLSASRPGPVDPTILIAATPATRYPGEMFERGVLAAVADGRVNPLDPFAGHKTIAYWPRLHELQKASAKGAAEAIMLQVTNHAAGGCVSNLFIVSNGELLTPIARGEEARGALPGPVLPGVTRGFVIDAAKELGFGCGRRMLAIADVLDADEVFLTNSSWGVLPVVKIEGKTIGRGMPGEFARRMRARWLESLETGDDGVPGDAAPDPAFEN